MWDLRLIAASPEKTKPTDTHHPQSPHTNYLGSHPQIALGLASLLFATTEPWEQLSLPKAPDLPQRPNYLLAQVVLQLGIPAQCIWKVRGSKRESLQPLEKKTRCTKQVSSFLHSSRNYHSTRDCDAIRDSTMQDDALGTKSKTKSHSYGSV